jgi:hypothetical protein
MLRPRRSRRYKRIFFGFVATFGVVFTALSGWTTYDHFHGGVATAEVVGRAHERKPLYTVSFVTEDGRSCEAILYSESGELAVHDRVAVHYDRRCLNVSYPGAQDWVLPLIGGLVIVSAGAVGSHIAWFHTDPDGRIRWRFPIRYADRP